ncbi:MAG: ribokinase [Chloroflexota bacterium]
MRERKPPKICVVGSSNIDLVIQAPRLPKLGETLIGHSFHIGYGGKGANQAVMAARLGAEVTMITKLARDVFGEGTMKNYREQGIDTTYIFFDTSCSSGVASIFLDDQAQNFIAIVPGANMALSPADVQTARAAIQAADVLVCQLEVPVETTLKAFRIARSSGVRTILNPAPAAPLLSDGRRSDELLQLTDICAPNETETELLTGQSAKTLEEAERAARQLLARGPKTIILTLGERGALLVEQNAVEHIPVIHVDAVDPTGAGDAFIGSLAVYLAEGLALRDVIRRANAIAALSVTRVGTQTSFPTRAEADAFLKKQGFD